MNAPKPIAEMLVDTMARIAAADLRAEANAKVAYVDLIASGYRAAASDIVAAVYGPPCDTMSRYAQAGLMTVESPEGRPADQCAACGWPRSFHQ